MVEQTRPSSHGIVFPSFLVSHGSRPSGNFAASDLFKYCEHAMQLSAFTEIVQDTSQIVFIDE